MIRRLVGLSGALVLVSATLVATSATPAHADKVRVTADQESAVSAFYRSKGVMPGAGSRLAPASTRLAASSTSIGNDYFDSFLSAYEDDPGLTVGGMDVVSSIITRTPTDAGARYRVSVRVSVRLTDKADGSTFTGGETIDHLLDTVEQTEGPIVVRQDRSTGVSTAPLQVVAETAADIATVKDTTPLPAWQLRGKRGGAAPANSKAESGSISAQATAYPTLNYQAVANYASLWTDDAHANQLNSKYGDAGNNCSNFISQALNVGGWPIRDTTYPYRANLNYWDYNMTGPGTFTYSWSRAEESYRMVHDKAGKSTFSDLEDGFLADLAYFDWNVGGAKYGDGIKDHVIIVTKRTSAHPYYSQKSGNRHNVPPSTVISNFRSGGGTQWKVLGLRT